QALKLQTVQGRGEITLIGWPKEGTAADGSGRVPRQMSLRDVLALQNPVSPEDVTTEIYRRTARSVNWFRDGKLVQQSGIMGNTAAPTYQTDNRPAPEADQGPQPPAPGIDNNSAAAKAKPAPRKTPEAPVAAQQAGVPFDPTRPVDPQFF